MTPEVFPYEIQNVTEEEDKLIKKYYKDYIRPFIRVGPTRHLSPAAYGDHANAIYNLDVRPDDIWVVSFSRSGTTWLQELVWLVMNNLDFESAKTKPLNERFAFIEYPTAESEVKKSPSPHGKATFEDFRTLPSLPSPRYVKTHLPLSLLPPKLLDVAKVFYIARHPLDVAVSFFFMHKLFRYFDENVTLEEFWELFKKDLVLHAPVVEHVKEAWLKRDHPNLMFLFYEEMQNDLLSVIDGVCAHLQRDYSLEQKRALAEHLSFDNMKKTTGPQNLRGGSGSQSEMQFMRKGKAGNWVNYFTGDLRKDAEQYFDDYYSKFDDLEFLSRIRSIPKT